MFFKHLKAMPLLTVNLKRKVKELQMAIMDSTEMVSLITNT